MNKFRFSLVAPGIALSCFLITVPAISAQETGPARSGAREYEHPPAHAIGPPAPLIENTVHSSGQCAGERCEGSKLAPVEAFAREGGKSRSASLPPQFTIARTGKRTRGSNTQLTMPQNLQLADVDNDGRSDFIQTSGNKLFVSKTDFNKTGITHLYAHRPIKRVLTGDFHGDRYDQTCTITDDNTLVCYGISTDHSELWWWFTQGSFVADNEDAIVGDFDGDGRDRACIFAHRRGFPDVFGERRFLLRSDASL